MTATAYPHLFSPFSLGGLTLKNRVVMSPMSTEMGGEDGSVTPRMIAFYRERALGGVGLITVEFTSVSPETGRANARQLTLEAGRNLDGHIRLVQTVQEAGAHVFMQMQHSGQFANAALLPGGMPIGPSDVYARREPGRQIARAMSVDEINRMIEAFGGIAELAVEASYDGVELHGAHGYLLTQFLSPLGNRRDDQWGGDFERRLRFPIEVITRVKAALGHRPLCFRLSADEFTPGGLTIDDLVLIVPHLRAAGVDVFHVSTGWGVGRAFATVVEPMSTPEGWRIPYAKRIKDASGIPVIAVGQIRWPETAEAAIADGQCDLIALGRPMLADPYWAAKAEAGRRETIRPCTSCNWCVAAHDGGNGVGCAENPRTGFELDPPLTRSFGAGRKAVIVGGGPGGIVAALLLDQAGFESHLFERRHRLGGGLVASAAPPGKDKLSWYETYLLEQVAASGVRVHLNQTVDAGTIVAMKPHITIVAAGTRPHNLPIEGVEGEFVMEAFDVLMGDRDSAVPAGGKVVIYGGGETGCEIAEYMAARGVGVMLVTRSPKDKLARSADWVYRMGLISRIAQNPNITVLPNSVIVRADNGNIHIEGEHAGQIRADRLLLAQGRLPDDTVAQALAAAGIPCTVIGDSRKVGRIGDAVHMAYAAVQLLHSRDGKAATQSS
jgi:2,4-dienoyl-CoA reductase-like NADH-dependent reductase (Old Yellow Enzyme family)/thioredoxin reductase